MVGGSDFQEAIPVVFHCYYYFFFEILRGRLKDPYLDKEIG
jgi:hypothetical protein